MNRYLHGVDVLGAKPAVGQELSALEHFALLVGALASMATLLELSIRWRDGVRK